MAYDSSASLKDRFAYARQCLVEMFPNRLRPGKTYQGFVKALRKIPAGIREQLQLHLCRHHERVAGQFWKRFGWIPFAVDGSRIEAPRTQANQEVLGCAGKEMAHTHLSFLIRVGGSVTLLTDMGVELKQQGDTVWLWPGTKRHQAPLKLRLIRLKLKTKLSRDRHDMYLLTNVFDHDRLSDEVAGTFYQMRWGVELFYRSFKRILDQHKLRSHTPQQAEQELHWALTAMLLLGLMSVDALASKQRAPCQLSQAESLRTVRYAMRTNDRWRNRGDLRTQLAQAVKDKYKRRGQQKARDWPYKNKNSPPGPPKIRPAKSNEIARAKRSYMMA